MRRVAHPYMRWEDYLAGMYGQSNDIAGHVDAAFELLTDGPSFASAIGTMLTAWPTAAENWLTRPGAKSRSWLGAAACCHARRVPQHCTRQAWWLMTEQQQGTANAIADAARLRWNTERRDRGDA